MVIFQKSVHILSGKMAENKLETLVMMKIISLKIAL